MELGASTVSSNAPLSPLHEVFFAIEMGDCGHVASVLDAEGGAALLRRADASGATCLHAACSRVLLGPHPAPSFANVLTIVAMLVARGSDPMARLSNGIPCIAVPLAGVNLVGSSSAGDGALTTKVSAGGITRLPSKDRALIIGAVASASASPHLIG